ncbi:MAG: glycosyltransferase family 2 protein [Planctomycetota bacterium]
MRLLIAIVNYRTGALVADCLRSLASEMAELPGALAVVADNASGDGSVELLERTIAEHGFGAWARVLALPANGGFSYGNNRATERFLDHAAVDRPEYVLFLNPDTVVRPGALRALLAFMDAHADVGIAGSRLEDPDGTPQHCRFRFLSIPGELEHTLQIGAVSRVLARYKIAPPLVDHAHPIDWVSGASMIVRRAVFDDVGLMDEEYFLYYEELDFTLRAARAGWPCWFVPESRVVHLVGQSTGVTNRHEPPKRRPRYWFDSRRRYFVKNYGPTYCAIASLAWLAGTLLRRAIGFVRRRPVDDPPHLVADFLRYGCARTPHGRDRTRTESSETRRAA